MDLNLEIVNQFFQDVTILADQEVLKNLAHILKTNVAACKSIGSPFFSQVCVYELGFSIIHHFQLKRILNDMLSVYQVISSNLNKAVHEEGEQVLKFPLIKQMRVVKKEILTLLSTWISRAFEGRTPVNPIVSFVRKMINFCRKTQSCPFRKSSRTSSNHCSALCCSTMT